MAYRLHIEPNGIVCKFVGDFSDEMCQANTEILSHPDFAQFKYQILDLTEVTSFSISHNVISAIARQDMAKYHVNPDHRIAVICTRLLMVGLNNVYLTYSSIVNDDQTWVSEIFETEQEARHWLST